MLLDPLWPSLLPCHRLWGCCAQNSPSHRVWAALHNVLPDDESYRCARDQLYSCAHECYAAEQEATELSAQFARVEGVFAEGDAHRIAAALAGIRRGLALVGDVPEFRGGARAPPGGPVEGFQGLRFGSL